MRGCVVRHPAFPRNLTFLYDKAFTRQLGHYTAPGGAKKHNGFF